MRLFKKQTKTFYNIFSSKRAFVVVFLAVLVLGFSVKSSLAVKTGLEDPPKPGTPVSQLSPAWKTAFDSTWVAQYMWYDTDSQGNKTVPKTAFRYESFLKGVGDYTQEERFQAGQKYKSDLGSEAKIDNQRIQQYETGQASHAGALAGGMKDTATDWLFAPIIAALFVITYFLKYFVGVAGSVLDIMLQPNIYNFTGNPMIQQGWVIVRDVCNLFFLLVLLFIAICTILKIEKYHAKKTLLMLIIMALLINFSKPITVFIFDGSQLLMNEFLKQMGNNGTQQASTMYMKASGIAQTLYDSIPAYSKATDNATLAVQYLFAVVFLFMLLVAFLVIAIFFIIRIVVIMLLIIVSPFAFFAAIIPDFSKMSSQWWSALFEYSYYGPAAAFFLLLATKLSEFLPQLTAKTSGTNVDQLIQNSIHYITTIVFLYASIFMAKKFGGAAGSAVVGNANKFMKWGTGMTKTGGVWGWTSRATGVTGATSQKLQQSKWTRWATKEGRKEAQEEHEAWLGEKIGVKGAMERQVQKRAKKYKDEHYTEEALKSMAAKGDAAAAFLLSENGDMDNATYAALQSNRGYKGNVKKMVDKKLKKKQLHIFVDGQLDNFITEQATKGTTYANRGVARQAFADQEFGKLSPVDVKEQDIEELAKDPVFVQALKNAYSVNTKNQNKIVESMSANKYAAGQAAGIGW